MNHPTTPRRATVARTVRSGRVTGSVSRRPVYPREVQRARRRVLCKPFVVYASEAAAAPAAWLSASAVLQGTAGGAGCYASDERRRQYAWRAGVEGTLSQGIRAFGLRRSRYRGLAKTHLQNLVIASAINLDRLVAWLDGRPRALDPNFPSGNASSSLRNSAGIDGGGRQAVSSCSYSLKTVGLSQLMWSHSQIMWAGAKLQSQ